MAPVPVFILTHNINSWGTSVPLLPVSRVCKDKRLLSVGAHGSNSSISRVSLPLWMTVHTLPLPSTGPPLTLLTSVKQIQNLNIKGGPGEVHTPSEMGERSCVWEELGKGNLLKSDILLIAWSNSVLLKLLIRAVSRYKTFLLRVRGFWVTSITLSRDHSFPIETAFGRAKARHEIRAY